MKMNLTFAVDGFSGQEHNFPLPNLYEDVVRLTAATRIAYTPTLLVTYSGPAAENFYYANESPHDDAKLRRFTPYPVLAARTLRRAWFHPREYVFREVAASSKAIFDAGGQVGIGAQFNGGMAINKDTWERLPEELQQTMAELGRDYSRRLGEIVMTRYDEALAAVVEEGATVVALSDAEKRRWIDGLPDIAGNWVASAEARGHPAGEVLRIYMDAFRARGGQPLRDWDRPQ